MDESKGAVLRFIAVGLLALAAACGGGGSGSESTPSPQLASGKLDTTYGSGGFFRIASPPFGRAAVYPDGSAFLLGQTQAKLDAAGTRADLLPVPTQTGTAPRKAVIDASGNVYALLTAGLTGRLVKTGPDGQPVAQFGAGGVAAVSPFSSAGASSHASLARDPTGKLYVGGDHAKEGFVWLAAARYTSDGMLDPTFGSNGSALVPISNGQGSTVVVDQAGSVFLGGYSESRAIIAKLDASGRPDASFGVQGIWRGPDCGGTFTYWMPLALDNSGALIAGFECGADAVVFKISPAGVTVADFRDSGRRTGLFGSASASRATDLLIGPEGTVYVAGERINASSRSDFAVAKLNAAGNPVPGFGTDGVATFDVNDDVETRLSFDGSGRLYVSGRSLEPSVQSAGRFETQTSFTVYRLGP